MQVRSLLESEHTTLAVHNVVVFEKQLLVHHIYALIHSILLAPPDRPERDGAAYHYHATVALLHRVVADVYRQLQSEKPVGRWGATRLLLHRAADG